MDEFINFIQSSTEITKTLLSYGYFTNNVEYLYEGIRMEFSEEIRVELDALVFDLEVINALALADFELLDDSNSLGWSNGYKKQAENLIHQLLMIVLGKQSKYEKDY